MRGELPLERPAVLELVAGGDDPEARRRRSRRVVVVAAGDPPVHRVVLVVHGVLVLVVHLPSELRLHGVHQQDGLLVRQRDAAGWVPVRRSRHVPLDVVRDRHVVEPNTTHYYEY